MRYLSTTDSNTSINSSILSVGGQYILMMITYKAGIFTALHSNSNSLLFCCRVSSLVYFMSSRPIIQEPPRELAALLKEDAMTESSITTTTTSLGLSQCSVKAITGIDVLRLPMKTDKSLVLFHIGTLWIFWCNKLKCGLCWDLSNFLCCVTFPWKSFQASKNF